MSTTAEIEQRVRTYVAEQVPSLAECALVVLAVSGGADSMALAAILCQAHVIDPANAIVAHFDHGWRGDAAAARDRAVVEALCERYGMQLATGRWDAPKRSEAAARTARLAFLHDVARARDASVVVTGHTEDDQVETVMLNMARGAGTYGLAGMAPERPFPQPMAANGLRLARPLLSSGRAETRAYCRDRALAFVDDETNEDHAFARNRIRAMLDEAYEETPEAREILLQTAAMARVSVRTLEASLEGVAPCAPAEDGRVLAFDRAALRSVPEEIAIYAWHPALDRLLGDARDFGRQHFQLLARAAAARTGSTFQLPRGVVVTVDADRVLLGIGPLEEPQIDPLWEHPLPFAGLAAAWEIRVIRAMPDETAAAGNGWQGVELLLEPGAVLRARRPGDRVTLAGLHGHRKLQDAYVDAKVPRRMRDAAPVIASGRQVLWSPLIGAVPSLPATGRQRWCVRWRRSNRFEDRLP